MTVATSPSNQTSTYKDTHQEITDIILEQLEKGVVPWQQPWRGNDSLLNGLPFNTSTGNRYRGINILLLWSAAIKHSFQSNEWGTFNHWKASKEFLRAGEKGNLVIKFDVLKKEIEGEETDIPYIKKYYVFNRSQLQSWKPVENQATENLSPNDLIVRDTILDEFVSNTGAIVISHDGGAYYNRLDDKIRMPNTSKFVDTTNLTAVEGYYSTLLHELTHWSGAPNRLNRIKGKKFGDQAYAYEELVAELGAAFLCAEFKISTLKTGDHAAYISTWIKVLRDNKKMLVTAAADASKAYDYLFELQPT